MHDEYDEHERQVAELQRMLEVQGAQLAQALDVLEALGFDPIALAAGEAATP